MSPSHVHDCKHATLHALYGDAHINELFHSWLASMGALKPNLQDKQSEFLDIQGIPPGHLNGRWKLWLAEQGFDLATLADSWKAYWCSRAGDPAGTLPDGTLLRQLPLLTDRYDARIEFRDNEDLHATLVRASGATVKDHEGNIRTLLNDEIGFVGARRVENLTPVQDLTTWTEVASAVALDEKTVQFAASTSSRIIYSGALANTVDEHTISVTVKHISGGTGFHLRAGDVGKSPVYTTSSTPTRFSYVATTGNNIGLNFINAVAEVSVFEVTEIQVEVVTDQANQAPSEFILPNDSCCSERDIPVRCFPYANGNTVDANGVVTEARGADLTTLEHAQSWEKSTNLFIWSNDVTGWTANNNAAAIDYESFIASARYGYLGHILTTVDSESYTITCKIKVDDVGGVYAIYHNNSATGNSTSITPTGDWVEYETTILGRAGGGNVTFGIIDSSVADWGKIYVKDFNVVNATYATPFIPTNGTAVTRLADDMQTTWPAGLVNDFLLGCDANFVHRSYSTVLGIDAANYFRNSNGNSSMDLDLGSPGQILSDVSVAAEIDYGQLNKLRGRLSATQGLTLFVNDVNISTNALATTDGDASGQLYIGSHNGALGRQINGTVGNINLYSGDLSDEEVYLIGNDDPWAGMSLDFEALNGAADVQAGVGGLTTVRNSEAYVFNPTTGIYDLYGVDEPLWMNGKLEYFPEALNLCLNSSTVASQAITVVAGKVTISAYVEGDNIATAIVTAGTATATGYGTADKDTPIELDVTVGGTINVEITGAPFTVNVVEKSLAEARGLPPIPTEGAAKTMLRTDYSFDIANHDNADGIWVCDWEPSYAERTEDGSDGILTVSDTVGGVIYEQFTSSTQRIASFNGTSIAYVSNQVWGIDENITVSVVYHAAEAEQTIIRDDDSGIVSYSGFSLATTMDVFHSASRAAKISNLRRYHIISHIQGKAFVSRNFPPLT